MRGPTSPITGTREAFRRLVSQGFGSLGIRLAVQFGALFTIAMMVVAAAISVLVTNALSDEVESELRASGAVFDRLWQQRVSELAVAGNLVARDFGFREAVATGDEATMRSALDNIRARARVENAFIVSVDGSIRGLDDPGFRADAAGLWDSLDEGQTAGVAYLGGRVRQVIAAPIFSPQLVGWLVLVGDVDARRLMGLERLSSVPLRANVLIFHDDSWKATGKTVEGLAVSQSPMSDQLFDLDGSEGGSLALARPIATLGPDHRALLLLTYPKSVAYAQQRRILIALALLTLLGLSAVLAVTWRASKQITRPLARLDQAAARIADGRRERVEVSGRDELARLGNTFNRMAGEIEERELRISHLAFNDTLTGLPNRALFNEQLAMALKGYGAGEAVALHFLDLDHFKTINDTLGHPAGDLLLAEVAQRLAQAAQGHFVARMSGDEFAVIQRFSSERDAVDRLAASLLDAVARPFEIDSHMTLPSTSIGIALHPTDGGDAATLTRHADLALDRAKETGRGTFAYFEASLNEQAQRRRQIEADLRTAISEGQFELWYQPLFNLASGEICSFEALLRWRHPQKGLISPAEFIPVAEDSGLIVPIGAWVLRTACEAAVGWPEAIRIAVNASSVQFHHGGLSEHVMQALSASGLAPNRLEIELTESVFLKGDEVTLAMLHSLRALGIRIALDDFGTGYSSLSYLQSFPFDKLKIDQSFIRNLLTQPGAKAVVRAIIDLAAALGIETTAEGVEEPAQLEELRKQGCETVQGYLFSRPIERHAANRLLGVGYEARSAGGAA